MYIICKMKSIKKKFLSVLIIAFISFSLSAQNKTDSLEEANVKVEKVKKKKEKKRK